MSTASSVVTAERLFREAFLPLYPRDVAADLARARTEDANPALNPTILGHLAEAAAIFAELAPHALAAHELALDFSDASVHRLGAALTREARERWMAEPSYGTSEGTLFNFVVHGAAYLGECIVRRSRARASDAPSKWLVRSPLWESLVELRSPAGETQLAVFHWWLKALGDDALAGETASLVDRYRTHVEEPTLDVDALPAFLNLDVERKLPRLAKVRYDALYKYLRAHLPEIRDLGRDFPSPERFDDMRLRWLDAHVVGGGRMALLVTAGDGGVHLFWLDASGFVKGAFVPADKFPEPVVRIEGDLVRIVVQQDGASAMREMFWWGI